MQVIAPFVGGDVKWLASHADRDTVRVLEEDCYVLGEFPASSGVYEVLIVVDGRVTASRSDIGLNSEGSELTIMDDLCIG